MHSPSSQSPRLWHISRSLHAGPVEPELAPLLELSMKPPSELPESELVDAAAVLVELEPVLSSGCGSGSDGHPVSDRIDRATDARVRARTG